MFVVGFRGANIAVDLVHVAHMVKLYELFSLAFISLLTNLSQVIVVWFLCYAAILSDS